MKEKTCAFTGLVCIWFAAKPHGRIWKALHNTGRAEAPATSLPAIHRAAHR